MKIYFCDGCNESIPLADVQSGQVTTIKGKLFCRNCIPPGALAGPPATAPRVVSSAGRPLLTLLVVLLVAWTAWRDRDLWLGVTGDDAGAPSHELQQTEEARRRMLLLEADLFALREQYEAQGREISGLASAAESMQAEAQARAQALASLGDEVQRQGIAQSAAGQLVERVQINANRVSTLELRVDALSQAVAAHDAYAAQAERRDQSTPSVGAAGMSSESVAQPAGPAVDPMRLAAMDAVRRLLLDPEPDKRFEGVDEVERGNYRELASDLVPLLQDEDMFVRLHAMNVLGNFGCEEAVPVLFDVLDDANAAIRKSAAETLVRLTGYDPGFDHKGSSADRTRATKKWRDWFEARGA